ncbi:MAG: hypothetical protein PHC49_18290 [Desulfuromonadaceae bacterium]|nr:hypothetical protein [Desulfuromonadaceae bacterium]
MGLFWDYFLRALRLPFIQRPGPLAMLAEGGADSLDAARTDMLGLRDQFFPSRCDDAFLYRFAAARGIVRHPLEPAEHWAERIRFAYAWWVSGGRESAMAEALTAGFGFTKADVFNMRIEDPARWASFKVWLLCESITVPSVSAASVIWAINEVKPARSKLATLGFATPGTMHIAAASAIGITVTTPAHPEPSFQPPARIHITTGCVTGMTVTTQPQAL